MNPARHAEPAADYAEKIRAEGEFWDREFLDQSEVVYRCFLHHSPRLTKLFRDRFLADIFDYLRPGARALDYGCGHGWLSLMMARTGATITGIDVAERCLEQARRSAREKGLANCRFDYLDVNTGLLPEGAYDLIVSWGSLHHVQNLQHALDQIAGALAPNGRFILVECVEVGGARGRIAALLADFFHLVLPTDRSYAAKLRHAWGKLTGNREELEWSPFEMAAGGAWPELVHERFVIEKQQAFMGFLSPFVTRLRLPPMFLSPLVAILHGLDTLLLRARVLKPEYFFMVGRRKGDL